MVGTKKAFVRREEIDIAIVYSLISYFWVGYFIFLGEANSNNFFSHNSVSHNRFRGKQGRPRKVHPNCGYSVREEIRPGHQVFFFVLYGFFY